MTYTFSLFSCQVEDDKFREFEVWQGLANLYSSLSYWKDAEICLEKARALKPFSAATLYTEGKGQSSICSFINWFPF